MMVKEDDAHVSEWEDGLPTDEELTPLSHSLISPALASAFSIKHEPAKTAMDVQRGSRDTLHNLRNNKAPITSFDSFPSFQGHENRGMDRKTHTSLPLLSRCQISSSSCFRI
jgi:hypothetical protein